MKTTNYELSKKLAKIGFKARTDKCWAKIRGSKLDDFTLRDLDFSIAQNCDQWFLSYGLEEILEALPGFLDGNEGGEFNHCSLELYIGYGQISYSGILNGGLNIIINKTRDESLADTAARLLILLHEKDLIEFGGENE